MNRARRPAHRVSSPRKRGPISTVAQEVSWVPAFAGMTLRRELDFSARPLICTPTMLTITDLTYRIQGRPLFEGASLVLPDGAKAGFVGKNGSGKTTLFRLIQGQISLDSG